MKARVFSSTTTYDLIMTINNKEIERLKYFKWHGWDLTDISVKETITALINEIIETIDKKEKGI